ncbi:armadillo-type protein [Circinella umbellata]|nr:armadillo-type protein [Circinella umbellata]
MDQAVYETLLQVGNPDGSIRSAAEQRLKELETTSPEYPVSLARLTVSQELAVPHRQLAALTLKTYVTNRWTTRDDETFQGPEPSPECKNAIREIIVLGLGDRESKIRVVSAYVVSKIAHDDFPEDWPNLFDVLVSYLKSNSVDGVHGAMRVLLEMVQRDISIQQLPQIGPVLIPELYTILTSDNVYSFRTRGRAVSIFNSCVQMLDTLRDDNPEAADQFIAPILPQWMQAFHTILAHHVQNDAKKATEEYGLKMEVVRCIRTVSGEFGEYIRDILPQLMEPIWGEVYNLRERYIAEFVSDSDDAAESFQDSDGNEIGFQSLLYSLFEFMESACTKKSLRHLFVNNGAATSFFEEVIYVLIVYMQITQEQMETWSTDANQYVADEEDGTFTYSARVASWDVLTPLQDSFPGPFAAALQAAVQRHITESNAVRAQGNNSWWKIQEACLLAIGRSAEDLIDGLKDESRTVQFDLKSLFDHVVLESMNQTAFPFLQGRAFVFASEFAKVLPTEMASQYVMAAVNALQSPASSIPVKISALRALNNYCKDLDPQYSAPYQVNILEGACQLLPDASEESLMLLLQSLCSAVKINGEVAAKYEYVLTPAVLETWKKFPTDSIITSYILDLFESFAENPAYFPPLCARSFPFFDQVFKTPGNTPAVLASVVDLLTSLVRYGPSPLPNEFTDQMFPIVMQLGWSSEDEDVLQSVQECLKQYIIKDTDHIIQWNDGAGKSGMDYVIHFVARLLEPKNSASESLFVGDLIVNLIKKAGNNIASVLPELLNAVLIRLQNTDYQPFVQSLVLVFAHLIIQQQDTVFQFLCTTNINGRSGLEILLPMWCDYFGSFSGYYSLKVSAIALSKLFLINDPHLQNLTVRGDIVANPEGGIVTRSKAKRNPEQYTVLPVQAKIIRLLVDDLQNNMTTEQQGQAEEVESVGDDEWEDEPTSGLAEIQYLSDMLAELDDDYEENNPELKDDPIYQTDMKAYLLDFFRNCTTHNTNNFMEIFQQHLDELQKETLNIALKN